jgi:hypothetical protein
MLANGANSSGSVPGLRRRDTEAGQTARRKLKGKKKKVGVSFTAFEAKLGRALVETPGPCLRRHPGTVSQMGMHSLRSCQKPTSHAAAPSLTA